MKPTAFDIIHTITAGTGSTQTIIPITAGRVIAHDAARNRFRSTRLLLHPEDLHTDHNSELALNLGLTWASKMLVFGQDAHDTGDDHLGLF
jgi:hypothetical protein